MRGWRSIHTWSSLVCTAFLLMLCVTGLPLVFKDEIDNTLYPQVQPQASSADEAPANLDDLSAAAHHRFPGEILCFLVWDKDEPGVVLLNFDRPPGTTGDRMHLVRFDSHTMQMLDEPKFRGRVTHFFVMLHTEMFAGIAGKLFLGAMGLLFIAAIISGVVLYGPSMRKLEFGTVRDRSTRLQWLDLHNLLGIVTVVWALVVGATGAINTGSDIVLQLWQRGQLRDIAAEFRGTRTPAQLSSLQQAVSIARAAEPEMIPSFVAFPGSPYSTPRHYNVFMRGSSVLTSRLIKPVLIDADSGALAGSRDLPWYATALLLSQPLHFGDYGGLPLKILWSMFDCITIAVLGSGIYLWISRHRAWRVKTEQTRPQVPGKRVDATIMTSHPQRRGIFQIFCWPFLLALATAAGLAAGLLGQGGWDAISWVALASPLIVVIWLLFATYRAECR